MWIRLLVPRRREPPLSSLQNPACVSPPVLARPCARVLAAAALTLLVGSGRSLAATTASYAGRVASAASTSAASTVTLTSSRQVAAGDALLVAVLLSSKSNVNGSVTATDA